MAEGSSLLKNGNKVLIDNQPYLILENEFVNPGKGQAFTRIKNKKAMKFWSRDYENGWEIKNPS